MSVVTLKPHASNPISLETTSLNSLTSTGTVTGTAYTSNTTDRYLYADFELVITYGTNPTAGSIIQLGLLRSVDGTNYEDASDVSAVGGFVLAATTSAQRLVIRGVPVGPFKFKPYIAAKTTGQTAAASGNTLSMSLYTPEVA